MAVLLMNLASSFCSHLFPCVAVGALWVAFQWAAGHLWFNRSVLDDFFHPWYIVLCKSTLRRLHLCCVSRLCHMEAFPFNASTDSYFLQMPLEGSFSFLHPWTLDRAEWGCVAPCRSVNFSVSLLLRVELYISYDNF